MTPKTYTFSKKTYIIQVFMDEFDKYECICDVPSGEEPVMYEFPNKRKRDSFVKYLEKLNQESDEGKFLWATAEVDIDKSPSFTNYVNPELN